MSKSMRWVLEPAPVHPIQRGRRAAALALRRLAVMLAGMAKALRQAPPPADSAESLSFEFHAEAGAPEGALFVNGIRVGSISGVSRL